jgi:hypothetical protein
MDRRHLPFWLLTLTVGGASTLPKLAAEGTFLDGEIYASLARNLAAGRGTFWAPHFSATTHARWFEHPPLGLALQAVPFRLLGDHLWVEHLYALLVLAAGGALLLAAWRRLLRDEPALRALGWLPLLLWLANPQVTWAHANDMLEATMSLFTFGAAWLTTAGLLAHPRPDRRRLALAPVVVLAAVLTKDVVGLFPLAVAPALAAAKVVPWRRALAVALAQMAAVAALLGLLLLWPAARENLAGFTHTQLVASLTGQRGRVGNQLVFLVKLFNTLLPPLLLAGLLALRTRRAAAAPAAPAVPVKLRLPGGATCRCWTVALLLLALAGSVPLVVSERQSLFYVVPSFPFYALGLALPVAPRTAAVLAGWRPDGRPLRAAIAVTAVLCLAMFGWSALRLGTVARDPAARADARFISAQLHAVTGAREPVVEVEPDSREDWGLETLLQRYGAVALSRGEAAPAWLVAPADVAPGRLTGWEREPLPTTKYHLYHRGSR